MKVLVCAIARDLKIKADDVYIDNQQLEHKDEMVYLESKITSYGKNVWEIKQRIALEKTVFSKNTNYSLQKSCILISRRDFLKYMYGVLQNMNVKHR